MGTATSECECGCRDGLVCFVIVDRSRIRYQLEHDLDPGAGFWLSLAGISPATYSQDNATFVSQGYTRVFFSTCGSTVSAIWRKP